MNTAKQDSEHSLRSSLQSNRIPIS
jgi:hypothetical protein